MLIKEKIQHLIERSLKALGVPPGMVVVSLDHPTDLKFGDYSSNIAMMLARSMGAATRKPLELAQTLADEMNKEIKDLQAFPVEKITVAAPGFINFYLSSSFFEDSIDEVLDKTVWYGKNTTKWNKRIIIEYTDPNPFKPFHIGHLMSNAIGESLSRIFEFHDAKITRANYGGDVGLHVAKAMWGMLKTPSQLSDSASIEEQIGYIGQAYVAGSTAFDENPEAAKEIHELNKKIYEKSDPQINELYDWGKKISLEHFNDIYKTLGSHFDYQFFESDMVADGKHLVELGLGRGVFEQSDGAIIFPGEKYGLHSRVFISSQGLPTYEAKELGLAKKKFELHDYSQSIVITAHEQTDYFKVVMKAMEMIYPEIASRTHHIGHGMLRFASGKMSSRKGNVITGESLLEDIKEMVATKLESRELSESEKKDIAGKVAVGAIKYSILKQTLGKDIIFDQETSISFDGDSGPYLQYTYVRIQSLLAKAKQAGIDSEERTGKEAAEVSALEKILYRFPEVVERAAADLSPNYIATYIIELAGEFNSYYAVNKIIDPQDPQSPHRVAVTEAVGWILKNGLWLLGIEVPEKM